MLNCSKCGQPFPESDKAHESLRCRDCRNAYSREYMRGRYRPKPQRAVDKNHQRILVAKTCRRCGALKMAEEFGKLKGAKDGKQPRCRKCQSQVATDWNREHPERFSVKQRRSMLKQRYGLTVEQWNEMFEAQGGGCAICGDAPTGRNRLAVDHSHATGDVRGLLCFRCNTLLGKFRDDPSLLRRAIAYLNSARKDERA